MRRLLAALILAAACIAATPTPASAAPNQWNCVSAGELAVVDVPSYPGPPSNKDWVHHNFGDPWGVDQIHRDYAGVFGGWSPYEDDEYRRDYEYCGQGEVHIGYKQKPGQDSVTYRQYCNDGCVTYVKRAEPKVGTTCVTQGEWNVVKTPNADPGPPSNKAEVHHNFGDAPSYDYAGFFGAWHPTIPGQYSRVYNGCTTGHDVTVHYRQTSGADTVVAKSYCTQTTCEVRTKGSDG